MKTQHEPVIDATDFRSFRGQLGRAEDAFPRFAADREERYPLDAAGGPCVDCGRSRDAQVVRAQWDYQYPSVRATALELFTAIGHAHSDRHRHGRFTTYHAACRACWRRWWCWRIAGIILLVPAVFGVGLGLVMAILFSIFYLGGTFSPSDRRQVPYVIAAGVAAAVAGAFLWRLGFRWRVPGALRCVAGYPIELDKLKRRPMQDWQLDRQALWDGCVHDEEGDEQ